MTAERASYDEACSLAVALVQRVPRGFSVPTPMDVFRFVGELDPSTIERLDMERIGCAFLRAATQCCTCPVPRADTSTWNTRDDCPVHGVR